MQPPAPPDPHALAEARDWLARAEEDVKVAELTLRASPALLGSSAYHSQQAAEKAFKAFLAAHQVRFRLVHDLVELQGQCQRVDHDFARFASAAQTLTPYATQFRYPGGPLAPSSADAEDAFQLGKEVVSFVRGRLGLL
jgi:HEPN domain-containing protein